MIEQEVVKPKVPPILLALQKTSLANADFKEWFETHELSKVHTILAFIKLPFILQIGLWLEYLKDNNLIVVAYNKMFAIMYVDETDIPKFLIEHQDEDGTCYYIHNRCSFNHKLAFETIEDSYRIGIIEGIKYIQVTLDSDKEEVKKPKNVGNTRK